MLKQERISGLISDKDHTLHIEGSRKFLTFPKLDSFPELRHLFTTRHGGVSTGCVSSWNLGERNLDSDENLLKTS